MTNDEIRPPRRTDPDLAQLAADIATLVAAVGAIGGDIGEIKEHLRVLNSRVGTGERNLLLVHERLAEGEKRFTDTDRKLGIITEEAAVRRGLLLPVVWSVRLGQKQLVRLAIAIAVSAAGGTQLPAVVEAAQAWFR